MAPQSAKQPKSKVAFSASRFSGFHFDPYELHIPEPGEPLYDERTERPLTDEFIDSVYVFGVKEPVLIVKREGVAVVMDGRRRVRAARAVKDRQLAERSPLPIRVPCMLHQVDDRTAMAIMVMANEQREDDDPLLKATKAQRLLGQGYTVKELASSVFGVTEATLGSWLKLLEVSAPVQKAIKSGEMSASAAAKLARLPKEDQAAAVKRVKAASNGKKITAKDIAAVAPPRPRMRNRAEIEERLKDKSTTPQGRAALRWVLRLED